MPPPPSQKGKFKPRKPAKKAASSSSVAASDASASTPTVVFAPSTDNATKRSGRDDSRGDPGGRGGRGGRGRGRGRGPIPSGRVFFTGAEKSTSTSSKRSAAKAAERQKGDNPNESTEEVVGQLEVAIGNSTVGMKSSILGGGSKLMGFEDEYEQDGQSGPIAKGSFAMEGVMYDSDSSREEERASRITHDYTIVPPLELPFPSMPLPVGIGSTERPIPYAAAMSTTESAEGRAGVDLASSHLQDDIVSPFSDTQVPANLAWEQNAWFLVQLPTRLPPLLPSVGAVPQPAYSSEDPMNDAPVAETNEVDPMDLISEVVTPPVVANNFDNTLKQTAPGRIGKIVVYKSGKTVLKLEGPDGSSDAIIMNVNEGLTCDFLQQAVMIDTTEEKYVELGEVQKSIIITPDLNSAFQSE